MAESMISARLRSACTSVSRSERSLNTPHDKDSTTSEAVQGTPFIESNREGGVGVGEGERERERRKWIDRQQEKNRHASLL
jgi:hypothetical protein